MPKRRQILASSLLLTVACVFWACGSDDATSTASSASAVKGSVQECLENGGATRAQSATDLGFLSKAEAGDEVARLGFTYDRKTNQIVSVWSEESSGRRLPSWLVWFAESLSDVEGHVTSPEELVEAGGHDTYVYFVNNAPKQKVHRLTKCIRFPSSRENPPVRITAH